MKYVLNKKDNYNIIYIFSRLIALSLIPIYFLWKRNVLYEYVKWEDFIHQILYQYDSGVYLNIAKHGYDTSIFNSEGVFAFFPLYPVLLRLIHMICPIPYEYIGIILNIVVAYFVCKLLYEITEKEYKQLTVFLFCYSPITYYLIINHTESLFILLTLLSYYLFKTGKYKVSGICLGLSMLTRNTGYVFYLILIIATIHQLYSKKINRKTFLYFSGLSTSVGLIYPIYLLITKGNPFYFINAQKYFNKVNGYVIDTLISDIRKLFSSYTYTHTKFTIIITFIFLIISVKLFIINIKNNTVLSIYLIIASIYPMFAKVVANSPNINSTKSLFRYILGCFSFYILIPYISKNKYIISAVRIVFLILYGIVLISNYASIIID